MAVGLYALCLLQHRQAVPQHGTRRWNGVALVPCAHLVHLHPEPSVHRHEGRHVAKELLLVTLRDDTRLGSPPLEDLLKDKQVPGVCE